MSAAVFSGVCLFIIFCLFRDDEDIAEVQRVLGAGQGVDPNEDGESLLSLACSAGYFELAQVTVSEHFVNIGF